MFRLFTDKFPFLSRLVPCQAQAIVAGKEVQCVEDTKAVVLVPILTYLAITTLTPELSCLTVLSYVP